MTQDEFIQSVTINDLKVDIGIDDYGQCYFFEYDKNGERRSESCGTYNVDYLGYIYYELDPLYRELVKLDLFSDEGLNKEQKAKLEEYDQLFNKLYKERVR